ncbi:MAG: DUF6520 family protein [Bacteroidota bacterium]
MKKSKIFMAAAFMLAIGAAYAFTTNNAKVKNGLANQTVFYNTGVQTTCPNSKICSDQESETLCQAGVTLYYNSQSPCATLSTYKFRPQ